MRDPCGGSSPSPPPGGGPLIRQSLHIPFFRGAGCVRCFCPFIDYPEAARPPLLGVYVDEEEAAAAAATAASVVSAAAAAAAELARVAAGRLLQQWGPREWTDPRARRQLLFPGAGGILVCSDKLLLRCSTLTGVCSSSKRLPAAACCCCFASQTPKGPLFVVGCADGALRVFAGRTLRLLTTLETTAIPLAAVAAASAPYARPSAPAAKQKNSVCCGSSAAAAAQVRETRGTQITPTRGVTMVEAAAPISFLSSTAAADAANGCTLQQTPTCLLLVGNNALLAGLGGGLAAAFFLENCRLAAVYEVPPSVRCFLQQQQQQQQRREQISLLAGRAAALQQLQLQQCREQAARKWRGEPAKLQQPCGNGSNSSSSNVSQVELSLEAQLPVCCLSSAAAERLVVMAVHPEAWRGIPLPVSSGKDSSSNNSNSTQRRWWRNSTRATYQRLPSPVAVAATNAAALTWGRCCSGNSNSAKLLQACASADAPLAATDGRRAAGRTANATEAASGSSDSVACWPLLIFQQHTGACIGTLWGGSSRTLAVGLGKLPIQPQKREQQQQQQQLCCLAVTTTHIHFWQQQGPSSSKRRLHRIRNMQQPRKQQQQANGAPSPSCLTTDAACLTAATTTDAAPADAAARLEQQQLLHEKRDGGATACPSFLCGCRASTCQLAAVTVAAAAVAAARLPVTEKPQTAVEIGFPVATAAHKGAIAEGGCVDGVWWSLAASFSVPLLLSQQQQHHQAECSLADAVIDWSSQLMTLLPNHSFGCCLLSWRPADGGVELVPLRWVQVAATGGSLQKPLLQRLWYNRGLLATSAADGYVRLLFRADLSKEDLQQEDVP